MRLHCEFSAPVARTDLDDYIRHLEISVGCYDEDALNEYIVGKLAVDQILWMDAIVEGVSLFEICDADSAGLHEVHTILTKGRQEFRPDLRRSRRSRATSCSCTVAVFHPSIHPYRQGVLDAAAEPVRWEESLAVMWMGISGLSETELADLGFSKIAGSDLIFRHSALRTPFHDAHPTGQDADDAVAGPGHEEWVMREWKRFQGITPHDHRSAGPLPPLQGQRVHRPRRGSARRDAGGTRRLPAGIRRPGSLGATEADVPGDHSGRWSDSTSVADPLEAKDESAEETQRFAGRLLGTTSGPARVES